MPAILALDQGTTSSRALLFDEEGSILARAQETLTQHYPEPGWVEHDPAEIWETQKSTAERVLEEAGLKAKDVAAVGISNQRETTLIWDRETGEPLCNAMVWQDRRTAALCQEFRSQGLEEMARRKTGLVLDPYFSGPKLRWMLDNVPGARELAEQDQLAFGTVDSYLLWKMTGGRVHATDVTNASRTLLFDIHHLGWDDELLDAFGIPSSVLPQVRPSSHYFGKTNADFLGAKLPVGGVAGDQQAAFFGQACFGPGMIKNTYGTGSFLLMNTGTRPVESRHRLLSTVGWQLDFGFAEWGNVESPVSVRDDDPSETAGAPSQRPGSNPQATAEIPAWMTPHLSYCLEGSVFVTGAAVQWLRDELCVIEQASDTEALAQTVPDNGGVYFIPAFVGLGAPYWDPDARGAIIGLTRGTGKAHLARAALEAACYQSRDVLEAMQADAGIRLADIRVDGGMTANDFLLQLQADILGIPVHRPAITETTALGAAYLAGLATGVWKGCDQIAKQWQIERTFEPRMSADQRESMYDGWKKAVKRALSEER